MTVPWKNDKLIFILPGEYSVRSFLWDLDPEGETVADPHSLHLLRRRVQDTDPR